MGAAAAAAADTLCALSRGLRVTGRSFETVVSAQSAGLEDGVHFHPVCLLATFQSIAFTRLNKISFRTLLLRCLRQCHYSQTCFLEIMFVWHGHGGTTRTVDNRCRRLHEQRPLDGRTMLHIPTHAFWVVYRSIYSWCCCCCCSSIARLQCCAKHDLYFLIQDTNWLSLLCI